MTSAADDLEHWCYDAIEPWSCTDSLFLGALTHAAEIAWIEFDSNPAMAANVVLAVQRVEDFLSCGAPAGTPASCAAEMRSHLLSLRRPGSTTWVEVEVRIEGPADRTLLSAELFPTGGRGASHTVPLPGPSYAGLIGWPGPAPRAASLRLLLAAGASSVELELMINESGNGDGRRNQIARHAATLHASARAGEHVRLEYVVDVSRASPVSPLGTL